MILQDKPSLYYDVREGKPINILDFYFRNFIFVQSVVYLCKILRQ